MTAKTNLFYLGKLFDLKANKILEDKLLYNPPDLTTHAIVTGMTGSGKTGLCVDLLEEAALQGIPALIVDPKGDLTNLILHFPESNAADFEPWIDPDTARRENKSVAEVAAATAELWKNGLADWGLGPQNIEALKSSVENIIFTPGSSAGIPINILSSFEYPDLEWEENEEALREKISSIITALLTLVGLKDIDPLRSREHILLSNIIEIAWRKGESLNLQQLILQTQNPPINKLGAFQMDDFFAPKDRSDLARLLNNFLASPSFQVWIEGQTLDIGQLLYSKEGKPRHSIFYLAHLSETERMFFVTLLFAAIESWMRHQQGTGNLRAMVYFDEILGYVPPVANPPSKPLLIRLFKQARAYGLGLVLTTQNPVDIDYKAISNAGTWMIGRLQTDQDKQRLLDGLESAAGGVKRSEFDRLISTLKKRVFLYHNVHEKKPQVFHTRWAMNYLAGPLMRNQIPALNKLAGVSLADFNMQKTSRSQTVDKVLEGSEEFQPTRKSLSGIQEFFLIEPDVKKSLNFKPSILGNAEVNFFSRTPNINTSHTVSCLVTEPQKVRQKWNEFLQEDLRTDRFILSEPKNATFQNKPEWMQETKWWQTQEKEFEHWIYESYSITVRVNNTLNIVAGPEISEEQFKLQSEQAVQTEIKKELDKLESKYKKKQLTLENKIERQKQRVDSYKKSLTTRGIDSALKVGETVINVLSKRKLTGLSTTSTKVRMTTEAKARLSDAEHVLKSLEEELALMNSEWESEKQFAQKKWAMAKDDFKEIRLRPTKQNIRIEKFGLAWIPD